MASSRFSCQLSSLPLVASHFLPLFTGRRYRFKMKSLLLPLVACSLLAPIACDQTPDFDSSQTASAWYFVRFNLPAGEQLTSLTGEMIVPPLEPTNGGTYYIWPGLETSTYDGIYQNVLSGTDSGTWAYFSGFCCTDPETPWIDNLYVYEGQTLSYSNVLTDTAWNTAQGNEDTGELDNKAFDTLGKSGKGFTTIPPLLPRLTFLDSGPFADRNFLLQWVRLSSLLFLRSSSTANPGISVP